MKITMTGGGETAQLPIPAGPLWAIIERQKDKTDDEFTETT